MKILINISLVAIAIFSATLVYSQEDCLPERLDDRGILVYDGTDNLSDSEEQRLNDKLAAFARSTSNQIVVLFTADLCGMEPSQYATEIGHSWGVGQDEFDNGAVILVKPTGGQGQRHTFIAVGYGLEGAIPDIIAKTIVDQEMIPNFSNGDFYSGLDQATTIMMDLAQGEYSSDEYAEQATKKRGFGMTAIIWLIIMGIFGISRIGAARRYSALNDVSLWTALWLVSSSGRRHSGSWGNFSSGSGGFGGGGFGGFGGGGFGGGGAGGSW
jgi:uncharacterized protein